VNIDLGFSRIESLLDKNFIKPTNEDIIKLEELIKEDDPIEYYKDMIKFSNLERDLDFYIKNNRISLLLTNI
jgi:hypothetical protein